MNCKPGDLAVIVRCSTESGAPHLGKVVRITAPSEFYEATWQTDPRFRGASGWFIDWRDEHLRPIRDSDGTDETLIYAGKPQTVEA